MTAGQSTPLQGPELTDNLTPQMSINPDAVLDAFLLLFQQELEALLNDFSDDPLFEM